MAPRAGLDRHKVAATAARIADAEGLETLTLQRVASELGVKSPSLYSHVDGLSGLRRDITILGLRELTRALTAASIGKSRSEALRAITTAVREFALARPALYASTVHSAMPGDEELAAAAEEPILIYSAVLSGFGIDEPELTHAMRMVRTAIHGFVIVEAANGFRRSAVDPDESFKRIVDALDRTLRAWNEDGAA